LAVAAFALASYALVVGPYVDFTDHILPAGDPFSYTVNWFRKIDQARSDYFGAIEAILSGADRSWYRLMDILLVAFSPLLAKEPASLCAVNFLTWGLGAAAFFHLGRRIGLGVSRSFAVAIIPWLWPISYGFADYTSTPVLALDAAFTGALHIALAMTIVFALDPRRVSSAILAAVSIGMAIWGRGNSIFVVGLVVFWPCITAFFKAASQRDDRALINVALVALIAGGMTAEFYTTYWAPLSGYYGLHVNLVKSQSWSIRYALPYLKNIPGYMMWKQQNSMWTIALSCGSHIIPFAVLVALSRGLFISRDLARSKTYSNLAATGAFIYYVTYATNLVLWNDSIINIDNALYLWRPMLIGLSLCIIVIFLATTDRLPSAEASWLIIPLFGTAIIWGVFWTAEMTPSYLGFGRPKPSVVERFTDGLDDLLQGKGQLAVLWYNNWNAPLLAYYRLKNDGGEAPLYYGPHAADIWSMNVVSVEDQAASIDAIVVGIKEAFTETGAVIIPEFTDDYGKNEPYALYRYHDQWASWVNSPAAPRMRVVMILWESETKRLLVLQRDDMATRTGDPLRLPWGERSSAPPGADYSAAVERVQ
jgi:hypothetical protein